MVEIIRVGTEDEAFAATSRLLIAAVSDALADRDQVGLIVTGGRTPLRVLPALGAAGLDWKRVAIGLTDERWVEVDDPASNEGQARRLLPDGVDLIGLKTGHAEPIAALAEVEHRLGRMVWPVDAVFLGLGEDGHIASLFPGAQWPEGGRVAAATAPDGMARLSLSVSALLDSRMIVMPVVGDSKAEILRRALEPGPVSELPVRAILHQDKVPVRVVLAC